MENTSTELTFNGLNTFFSGDESMVKMIKSFLLLYLSKLRFPTLFAIIVIAFIVSLFVPDVIPFIDEILIGLAALVLSRFKKII